MAREDFRVGLARARRCAAFDVPSWSSFSTRRSWRPPSNCVLRKASTILADLRGRRRDSAARQRTLALLCWRVTVRVVGVVDERGADLRIAVGRDAHADAALADEDAEVGLAGEHVAADRLRRSPGNPPSRASSCRSPRRRSPSCERCCVDGLLQLDAAVIGADGDAQGAGGRRLGRCAWRRCGRSSWVRVGR